MKKTKFTPSDEAARILKFGLAAVSAALIYTAFTYSSMGTYDAARSYGTFVSQIEHALMSLTITVLGAAILDAEAKWRN